MNSLSGINRLQEAVMKDCNDRNHSGCFNPNGCDKPNAMNGEKRCFQRYCDKYKWIMDRADHYAEKTGLSREEIIESWEKHREYWYMNYYQESNQPLIEDDRVKVFDTVDDLKKSFESKGFRCPLCEKESSNPYKCDSGHVTHSGKTCDWSVVGLLGHMGKGVTVFVKDQVISENLFMPLAWEE